MKYEAIICVSGIRGGKRYYEDFPLNVPVDLARGLYEQLSDLQVREFINDLTAEQDRRIVNDIERGGYDPFASQYRGGT